MATNGVEETGVLETDAVLVRTMRQDDLNVIVAIDAAASGRRRPRYFELMLQRSITQAGLQISLVAELDNRVVGFVIGSLYYGEYGVAEPTASIDAISVDPGVRGKNVGKALMRQLRLNLGRCESPPCGPKCPGTTLACWASSAVKGSSLPPESAWNALWIQPGRTIPPAARGTAACYLQSETCHDKDKKETCSKGHEIRRTNHKTAARAALFPLRPAGREGR